MTRSRSMPRFTDRRDSAQVEDWRDEALCRDYSPELWFPVGHSGPALAQAEQAKAICHRCPVRAECLDWALGVGADGIWGATDEDERRALKRTGAR